MYLIQDRSKTHSLDCNLPRVWFVGGILIANLLVLSTAASAQSNNQTRSSKVIFVGVAGKNKEATNLFSLNEFLFIALQKEGVWVEMPDIAKLVEGEIVNNACSATDCTAQLAGAFGVRSGIYGTVVSHRNDLVFTLNYVDQPSVAITNKAVIAVATKEFRNTRDSQRIANRLVEQLVASLRSTANGKTIGSTSKEPASSDSDLSSSLKEDPGESRREIVTPGRSQATTVSPGSKEESRAFGDSSKVETSRVFGGKCYKPDGDRYSLVRRLDGTLESSLAALLASNHDACTNNYYHNYQHMYCGMTWIFGAWKANNDELARMRVARDVLRDFAKKLVDNREERRKAALGLARYAAQCGENKAAIAVLQKFKSTLSDYQKEVDLNPAVARCVSSCTNIINNPSWGFESHGQLDANRRECFHDCDSPSYKNLPSMLKFVHRRVVEGTSVAEMRELADVALEILSAVPEK